MRYTYNPETKAPIIVEPTFEWEDFFEYDPSSPTFLINTVTRSPKAQAGKPAGCVGTKEIKTNMKGKFFRNARIIWELHNGPIPEGMLIHFRDKNEFNLLIDNLELQTHRQRGVRGNYLPGSSGYRGVSFIDNKYRASVKYKGKSIYLGVYDSALEASAARERALKLTE